MKLVILAVLLASSVARADELPDEERTATTIAVSATAAGAVMFGLGLKTDFSPASTVGFILLVVGPSAGHIYAHEHGHALGMTALRLTGAVSVFAGLISTWSITYDGGPGANDHPYAPFLIGAGAALYVASTVYDLWDAHRAVHRDVALAPMPTAGGAGLMVAGAF